MTYSSRETVGRILTVFLKLSREGCEANVTRVAEEALVSKELASEILGELSLKSPSNPRIEAALWALELGVDPEKVARLLDWREFEQAAAEAFKRAGYEVVRDLRFKTRGRRYQIDLLAYRRGIILLIDCKHWSKPPTPSEEEVIVEGQERRLKALAEALKEVGGDLETLLIPLVLTLYKPSRLEFGGHVFAPISKLRGLLEYLESSYFTLRHESVKIPRRLSLGTLLERLKTRED